MLMMYVRLLVHSRSYDERARWLERAWCNDDNADAEGL